MDRDILFGDLKHGEFNISVHYGTEKVFGEFLGFVGNFLIINPDHELSSADYGGKEILLNMKSKNLDFIEIHPHRTIEEINGIET